MSERPDDQDQTTPDPLDREAAGIDPRSDEAAEEIEELVEHAEELGRDPEQEVTSDPDASRDER